MDLPSKAIIDVLTYLLPGFITAALVYTLTPAPRQIPFERVVQALIFTFLVQVIVVATKVTLLWAGAFVVPFAPWTEDVALTWSFVWAVVLGLFVAWSANTDRIHRLLRRIGITLQTSYSSEWYGAFCQNRGFVVLHLKGERRLFGWAEEWPSTPGTGHFVVVQGEWLDDDRRIEMKGVQRVLVRAEDVEMVELMQPVTEEVCNGRSQSTDSTAAAAAATAGGSPR